MKVHTNQFILTLILVKLMVPSFMVDNLCETSLPVPSAIFQDYTYRT